MAITIDATKGWAIPASAAEYTELLAGSGIAIPDHAWPGQVVSGDLIDVIGTLNLVATSPVNLNYGAAATGWASPAVYATDSSGSRFVESVTDANAVSMVWFFVVSQEAAPAAGRVIGGIHATSSANSMRLLWTPSAGGGSDPLLRVVTPGGGTNGTVVHPPGSYVLTLRSDLDGTIRRGYSDLDTANGSPGGAAFVNTDHGFPGASADGNLRYLNVFRYDGANAEALDDAAIATIRDRIKNPPVASAKGHYYRRLLRQMEAA